MMQDSYSDPRTEPANYGTTSPGLPPPEPPPSTTTTITMAPITTFPSTSSSSFPGRTHYTHQQGLHRRRGSTASDHSTSTSPSSSKPPPRHVDEPTFNPDHLSRQYQGRYQSVGSGSGNNSNNDTSHALHPNITHYSNSKIPARPVFQETEVGGTTAPSIPHTKDNNSANRLGDTLQPNHIHPQLLQLQEYSDHPHAQTASSLASLGGGGVGGGGGLKGDDENAEFEVRVIANRTKDDDDDHHHQIQHLHNDEHASSINTTNAQQQGPGTGTESGVTAPASTAGKSKRLQSLDILRGITIIFMVLVNTQGADPFEQLAHTPWFGYTLADWVFPNFIFMVGMAIAIVLSPTKLVTLSRPPNNHLRQQSRGGVVGRVWRRHETRIRMSFKIVKRSCILFAIGLGLNGLDMIGETPSDALWIRIPGVLQRIGFCYLVLALSVLWSPVRTLGTSDPTASANHAQAKKDRAQSTSLSASTPPNLHPRRITPSTTTPEQKTLTSSRRVKILLPLLCTTLWFILTYIIQSSATEPIPSCLYPPFAISTNPSNSSETIILPGFAPSRGQLTPSECTAQSVLDTWLFTKDRDPNHPIFDAEGTLGTLMAVVTAWVGWMVGCAVVEQQRLWKGVVKGVIEDFEREMEDVEKERTGRRRRRDLVDESPKDTSESSSFDQQQPSAETMETIHSPPSPSPPPPPTREEALQSRITTHQRTHLLSHLGEWFMIGICTMFSGTILGWFLPICKSLWTPSFTLYSAGVSINTLCILMYLYDVPSLLPSSSLLLSTSRTKQPPTSTIANLFTTFFTQTKCLLTNTTKFTTHLLICYGRNPTLIYILSELVKIILEKIPVHGGFAWVQAAWSWLFFNTFYRFLPPTWASLLFSLCYVLVFAPLLWYLNRKGIYLRV